MQQRDTTSSSPNATVSAAPVPVCLDDYEHLAKTTPLPARVGIYHAGSGDEHTVRWNREAFARLRLNPRVMVDVSHIDTTTTLFRPDPSPPILLAPFRRT